MAILLNPLVWDLYFFSPEGALATDYFSGLERYADRVQHGWPAFGVNEWVASHSPEVAWTPEPLDEEAAEMVRAVMEFARTRPAGTAEEAQALLLALVESGEVRLSSDPEDILSVKVAMEEVQLISLGLYLAHPDTFVPYGYKAVGYPGLHQTLLQVAATFDLPLPPVAGKRDLVGRWLFLGAFSAALQEFRRQHDLSMPELLAFLYHFAEAYLGASEREELPAPRHAWLLVGGGDKDGDYGFLEETDADSVTHWQGSLDMQRGDVCVMYVRSPVSAVHSLCRVVEDAYVDPFFHYKHAVQIGGFQKVPRLPFRVLAADEVMAQSSHIARNLQGTSGQLLTRREYEAVLALLAREGLDLTTVPHLPDEAEVDLGTLSNERDVELQLVEPLLCQLGLRDTDWVRQLPIRMGRGERFYPDYAIGVRGVHPEVRAHALVEVKYRASGDRAWREAFQQAKSYGMRLGAGALLLAAADGVRLYQRQGDDFAFEEGQGYLWSDLRDKTLVTLARILRPT